MVGTSPTMTRKGRATPHPSPLPQGERGQVVRNPHAAPSTNASARCAKLSAIAPTATAFSAAALPVFARAAMPSRMTAKRNSEKAMWKRPGPSARPAAAQTS